MERVRAAVKLKYLRCLEVPCLAVTNVKDDA